MKIAITSGDTLHIMTLLDPMQFGNALSKYAALIGVEVESMTWREVAAHEIPEDRTFRAAWVDDGESICIDMERAQRVASQIVTARAKAEAPPIPAEILAAKSPEQLMQLIKPV